MKFSAVGGWCLAAGLFGACALGVYFLNWQSDAPAVATNAKDAALGDAPETVTQAATPATGRVVIGGIERNSTDVRTSPASSSGKREPPEKRQGFSPAVDPEANPQVSLVSAALRARENPERFNSFIVPKNFDAEAFKNDPAGYAATYASIVEPGRVFAPAQPGEGIVPLKADSKRFHRVKQGEAVRLSVKATPFAPVSFWSEDLGQFENELTSITSVAGEDGIATANFTASGGTIDEVHLLAASPVTSGQVAFIVSVKVP
jgi:hypothetical protein